MTKYKDAYTEVYEILEQLDEEEYNKIPSNVITAIRENRNTEYEFEVDEELELKEQELLPETKAILFNIFRDYLSTPEQKEKIIKIPYKLKNQFYITIRTYMVFYILFNFTFFCHFFLFISKLIFIINPISQNCFNNNRNRHT